MGHLSISCALSRCPQLDRIPICWSKSAASALSCLVYCSFFSPGHITVVMQKTSRPHTRSFRFSLSSLHAVITRVIYTFRIDFAPAAPNALPNVCTFRSSSVPFLCFSLLCLYMTLDGSLALRVYPSLSLAPFRPFPMIPPLLSYQASHSFFSSVPHSFRVSIALLFYTTYIDRIHAL